jgi:hypothetical protein
VLIEDRPRRFNDPPIVQYGHRNHRDGKKSDFKPKNNVNQTHILFSTVTLTSGKATKKGELLS